MLERIQKMIELRPYQNGAIENLRASIGAGNRRLRYD